MNTCSNDSGAGNALFFKVLKNQSSKYLFISIPNARQAYMTRHENDILLFNAKHKDLKILSSLQLPQVGHNPKGLKLIPRIRLGLIHLLFHKFKHSFQHTLNPNCGTVETTANYFLHSCYFFNFRKTNIL